MGNTLLFICGPHCSGKTTILKTLEAQQLIQARGSEIGKDLYYERQLQTAVQGQEFEMEIAQKELARDEELSTYKGVVAVETWHPGNIAYAQIRNPHVVPQLMVQAKQSALYDRAIGIWLRIPKETIKLRTQTFKEEKDWAGDFYTKIDEHLEQILADLQLLDRTYIIDANRPFEDVLRDVQQIVEEAAQLV